MQKITLGISGLHENVDRDCVIEERYRGPSNLNYAREYVIYRFCDAKFKKCCFPLKQ